MRGLSCLHELAGQLVHLLVHGIAVVRAGRAHHVAFHVAAGGERRKLHFVDALDGALQIRFQHAVQLQALPRGDPQRGVAHLIAQVQLGEKLIACQPAAGDGGADHEAVELGLRRTVDTRFGPPLAVVLLIRAVMLEQLRASLADKLVAVAQLLGDSAAKIIACCFGNFNGAELIGLSVFFVVGHYLYQIGRHYPAYKADNRMIPWNRLRSQGWSSSGWGLGAGDWGLACFRRGSLLSKRDGN